MRLKLPESARQRKRSLGGAAVSTLIHGTLIATAVVGTSFASEPQAEVRRERPLIFVEPPRRTPPPPQQTRPQQQIATNQVPSQPTVTVPLLNLTVVPDHLPPTDARIGTISEEEFKTAARDTTPIGPSVSAPELFTELMVEKSVQALSGNPAPRYPGFLASAGVEGDVSAQFVVDTAGRVEGASIKFLRSDHEQFERAVRDVLMRSRYVPAEVGNRRVRQLVEQTFAFALKRE